jgi:hypothetical protein
MHSITSQKPVIFTYLLSEELQGSHMFFPSCRQSLFNTAVNSVFNPLTLTALVTKNMMHIAQTLFFSLTYFNKFVFK